MEREKKNKRIKIAVILLAILLGLSLIALAGTVIIGKRNEASPVTAEVPDNLITPDTETDNGTGSETGNGGQTESSAAGNVGKITAAPLSLFSRHPQENAPFAVGNMFPGDNITAYFRVRVSYHGSVTVRYRADIRKGYEKLAEVLKVKITLLSSGEELYNGLMRDMPASLEHKLTSEKSTADELYYEVTAYLDTSVGNDYQNKDLIADFRWWVEETENLEPSPGTGDSFDIVLWSLSAAVSGAVCIILIIFRRRREEKENV